MGKQLGWYLLSDRVSLSSNSPGSAMVDGALELVSRRWYARYRCPIPHPLCISETMLRVAMKDFSGNHSIAGRELKAFEKGCINAQINERFIVQLEDGTMSPDPKEACFLTNEGDDAKNMTGIYPRPCVLGFHVPLEKVPASCIRNITKQQCPVEIANPFTTHEAVDLLSAQDFDRGDAHTCACTCASPLDHPRTRSTSPH